MPEYPFEERYFEDRDFAPGLKGGDEVRGYGYYPEYFLAVEAQLATLVELSDAGTLLDIGCGKAALAEYARRDLGVTATGVDRSRYGTRHARRRHGGEMTVRADCTQLPFADGAFDVVWCNGVLQYLEAGQAVAALGEIARIAGRAAFVSNIAAAQRHDGWGRMDPLTRLYFSPRQWSQLAVTAAGAQAWRITPLPFEGESALLFSRPEAGEFWPARYTALSLERMLRLGAIRQHPPGWHKG